MSDNKKLSGAAYSDKVKKVVSKGGKQALQQGRNAVSKATQNAAQTQTGDEVTDETSASISRGVNKVSSGTRKLKDLLKRNKAEEKAKRGAKKALKKAAKKAAEATKKAIKAIVKTILNIIKAIIEVIIKLIITFWWAILIIVLAIIVIGLLAAFWNWITNLSVVENNSYQDETVDVSGDLNDSINNAIAGAFYSKYAEQSLYVVISAPTSDTDAGYSDMTYEELGGTTDVEVLFQYGTDEFEETGVVDIDNYEAQLTLSPGFLSVLDRRMNEGYIYPEQFIKPVYASCVVSGDYSNFDDCELLVDEDDNILTASSVAYEAENGDEDGDTNDVYVKVEDEEMTSVSDWGLGTIAHYQAYYQPSRIYDYGITTVTIWNEDWDPTSDESPLITLAWDTLTEEEQEEILATYARGAEGIPDTNDDNTYNTGLYDVDSIITYSAWNEAVESAGGVWATIQNYLNGTATTLYSSANEDLWSSGDPGVSSGVPETEIVYVIDSAITMYGKIEFTITQQWVDQGISDHTQTATYIKIMSGYSVSYDTIVEDVDSAEGLKAVYDSSGTLLGYMDGSAVATYVEPSLIEDTSDSCTLNDVCEDEEVDGYWSIPLTLDENGEATTETITRTVSYSERNQTFYTFVRAYKTTVSAVTEGYLQTYMVVHSDASITSDLDDPIQYLTDYLSAYEAYIPYDEDTEYVYYCYGTSGSFTGYSIEEASTLVRTSSYDSVYSPDECDNSTFSILNTNDGHLMTAYYFNEMPSAQYLKIASLLGFVDDDLGEASTDTIEVNDIDIDATIGSELSTTVNDLYAVYGDLFETYGGAYGIDPTLLALIAAQEYGGVCDGDYYNDAADYYYGSCNLMQIEIDGSRRFEAYNFNLRQTTETSSGETTFFDVLKAIWNGTNTSSQIYVNLDGAGYETFEVTATEFANGYNDNGMSTVEMSIKAAAMYLQNLLDYYEGNIPLAIMAYNFGTGGLDAVLEIYEQQTGISREEVLSNPYDLGWFHYTTEVYTNPQKYIEGWTEDTYGDDEYLTNVLKRMTSASLYYVRTSESASGTGTVEGSLGIWIAANVTDSEEVYIARIQSSSTEADTVRAWRLLKQSSDFEEDWALLTLGQKSVDSGLYVVDGLLDVAGSAADTAILVKPEKSDTDISMIITTALAFSSGYSYNDVSYESDEFWLARFSSTLGTASYDKLNSTLAVEKVFGSTALLNYPSDDYEVIEEYGVTYHSDGSRTYSNYESILIGDDGEDIYAVVSGATVDSILQSSNGTYVVTLLVPEDDSIIFEEVVVIYMGLTTVNVSEGDTVNSLTPIGTAESGTEMQLYLLCDGEYNDLFGVIDTYVNQENVRESIFLTLVSSGLTLDDSAVEAGYVPQVDNEKIQEFLNNLVAYRGWSYRLGGNCESLTDKCDCSGLIYKALTITGLIEMRDMRGTDIYYNIATPVSADELQIGDIILFSYSGSTTEFDHIAVYMGEIDGIEYIFHAITNGVGYSPFDQITSLGGTWRDYATAYGRITGLQ